MKKDAAIFDSVMRIQDEKTRITLVHQFLLERQYADQPEKLQALKFFQEFQEFERDHDPASKFNSTRFGTQVMNVFNRVHGLSIVKKAKSGGGGNIYVISMEKE